jgi:hypothetical protein
VTWQAAVRAWVVAGSGLDIARVLWADQGGPRPSSVDGPWIEIRELVETGGGGDWLVTAANPLTVALTISAIDQAANSLTVGTHGRATGDGPVQLATTDTAPTGLATATDYWLIVVDATHVKLAASFLEAVETPTPIDITGAGVGTHSLASTAATRRAGAEITRTVAGTRTANLSIQCYGGASVDANGAQQRLKRTIAALSLPSVQTALHAANVGVAAVMVGGPQNVGAAYQIAGFEPRAVLNARVNVPIVDLSETGTVFDLLEQAGTVT